MLHQCFEQLLDLDLDQLRRRVEKKLRGHDERNLAHQGSLSLKRPCSLVECHWPVVRMRATSAGSCDAGASGGGYWGVHCDYSLKSLLAPFCAIHFAVTTSKCIKLRTNKVRDGASRGNFLRPAPCTHLVKSSEGAFECTPRNPLQQLILLWHSSDDRGFRVSPLAVLNHAQLLSRWDQ
jgi:hypothetical protein